MKLIPSKLTMLMMLTTIVFLPTQGFSLTAKQPKNERALISAYIPQMAADGKSVSPQYNKCFSGNKSVTCGSSALLKLVALTEPGFIIIKNTSSFTVSGIHILSSNPNIIPSSAPVPIPGPPSLPLKNPPSIPDCGPSLSPSTSCLLWVEATGSTLVNEVITIEGTYSSGTTTTSINVFAYIPNAPYGIDGKVFWGSGDGIYILQNSETLNSNWANPNINTSDQPSTDGQINTTYIVNNSTSSIASTCNNNGWYLPSTNELLTAFVWSGIFFSPSVYWASDWIINTNTTNGIDNRLFPPTTITLDQTYVGLPPNPSVRCIKFVS